MKVLTSSAGRRQVDVGERSLSEVGGYASRMLCGGGVVRRQRARHGRAAVVATVTGTAKTGGLHCPVPGGLGTVTARERGTGYPD